MSNAEHRGYSCGLDGRRTYLLHINCGFLLSSSIAVDVILAFVVVSIAVAVAIVLRVYLLAIRNKIPMFKQC